jgi:hypothetical protein
VARRSVDQFEAEYDLVRGQRVAKWVKAVQALGRSPSSAYSDESNMVKEGLVDVRDGRIYRTRLARA